MGESESIVKYKAIPEKYLKGLHHWFCHGCKANFVKPVYEEGDVAKLFRCPKCHSVAIEKYDKRRDDNG